MILVIDGHMAAKSCLSEVPSQNSNFPSPLTLFDEVRSDEEWVLSGPLGVPL